ncbi:MAG: GNAT family N-acetyltransferase [Firmicutes bacterium]|nr:GNAT family N-acetyltransferase [Bacillota bacterium]
MIRHYQSGDEAAIVALWNRACPSDPITMDLFTKRVLIDANFDAEGLILFEEAGDLLGFTLAIVRRLPLSGSDLEPDDGWITAFFVDPTRRRNGISHEMFKAAETFFRARSRRRVYFSSYAPNYFMPGVDPDRYAHGKQFLERRGFRTLYSPVAMDRHLVDYQVPQDVIDLEETRRQEGYVFEPLSPRYITQVVEFNDTQFNPDWARAVREAINRGVPLHQIFIARHADQVVGFCMYGGYDGVQERFGPFGVDDSKRGTGLGKILLYKCLTQMKASGLHTAWFLWTGEESPAGHLYFRAGFQVTRRFDVMQLNL